MALKWWIQKRDHTIMRKEAMDFFCYRVNAEAEMEKLKCDEGGGVWKIRRGEVTVIVEWIACSTPIPPLAPTADLKQLDEFYQCHRVLSLFGLNPILINPPGAAFQICETSRNQGLKRNQATVSCWSSQQSYLVWACHLSGQWMHEIREGEEEENVSTTEGEGDKGGRDWVGGVGGGGSNLARRRIKLERKNQNIDLYREEEEA